MKQKEFINRFIKNLMCENYAEARDNLKDIMIEKVKSRIREIELSKTGVTK